MVKYNDYLDLQQQPEDEEDGDIISSTAYVGGNSPTPTEMVGFTDVFAHFRDELFQPWRKRKYVPIVGMAGVGKTTLAKKILEDPLVVEKFYYRFFVPVGQGSGQSNKFYNSYRAIIHQLKEDHESFRKQKYLIVFDDVWDLDDLGYDFKDFPAGSTIIVTTRLQGIGEYLNRRASNMRFMNVEESWNLLRAKVFGEEVCPHQLEKAGKKIAENCGGLPLLIVTVADLLSRASRTPEHWEKLAAADVHNPVFEEAFDQILEVLYPSYYFLQHYAKPCFLYMAVFPPNHQVNRSRLFTLWSVEEFTDSEHSPDECLMHLISDNVVVACHKRSKRTI